MRNTRIFKEAREYLGLRREDVCNILSWHMEDLVAIENGLQPSLDAEGQLYKLYCLGDKDIVDMRAYDLPEGLSERDRREVVKMFLFAEEVRDSKAKVDR